VTLELELPIELDSAATARHAVDDLAAQLPEDQLGDVRLLVSELVTNALRHGELADADRIALSVDVRPDSIRVEVSDPGKGFEMVHSPQDPTSAEGWGLYLVATLSDRWGVETEGVTRVWFELDRAAAAHAASA
jgi:anti-sigma regulatory factor (Ser/Thr protein kinase)